MSSSYQESYQYVTQDYNQYVQPSSYSYDAPQPLSSVQYSAPLQAGLYPEHSTTAAQQYSETFVSSVQFSGQPASSHYATTEQYASASSHLYGYGSNSTDYYSQLQQTAYPGSYKTVEPFSAANEHGTGGNRAASTQLSVQYPCVDSHSSTCHTEPVDSYVSTDLFGIPDANNSYTSHVPQATNVSMVLGNQYSQYTEILSPSPQSLDQAYGSGSSSYRDVVYPNSDVSGANSVVGSEYVTDSSSSYTSAIQYGYSDSTPLTPVDNRLLAQSKDMHESPSRQYSFSNDEYQTANDSSHKYETTDRFSGTASERLHFWRHSKKYSQNIPTDEYGYGNIYEEPVQPTPEGQYRHSADRSKCNQNKTALHSGRYQKAFTWKSERNQFKERGERAHSQEVWEYRQQERSFPASSYAGGLAGLNANQRQKGHYQSRRGRGGGVSNAVSFTWGTSQQSEIRGGQQSNAEETGSFQYSHPFETRQRSSLEPRVFGHSRLSQSKERAVSRDTVQGGRNTRFWGSQNQPRFSRDTSLAGSQMLTKNMLHGVRNSSSKWENKNNECRDPGTGLSKKFQGLNNRRTKGSNVGTYQKVQSKRETMSSAYKDRHNNRKSLDTSGVNHKTVGKPAAEKLPLGQQKTENVSGNPQPGENFSCAGVRDQFLGTDQRSQAISGPVHSVTSLDKHHLSNIQHSVDFTSSDMNSATCNKVTDEPGSELKVPLNTAEKEKCSSSIMKQETGLSQAAKSSDKGVKQIKDDAARIKNIDNASFREKKNDTAFKEKIGIIALKEKKRDIDKKDDGTTNPGMTREELEREEEIQRKIRESVVVLVNPDQPTIEDIQNMFDPPPSVEVPEDLLPKLKGLLTQTHCGLCSLHLNAVQQAVQHYKGKNHVKRVRLFVSSNGNYSAAKVADIASGSKTAAGNTTQATASTSLAQSCSADAGGEKSGNIESVSMAGVQTGKEKMETAGEERECSKEEYCALCGVSFTSIKQSEQHYSGKNHAKKQRIADTSKLMEEVADNNIVKKGENNVYECTICNVFVTSHEQFTTHIQGIKHQTKLRQAEGKECADKPLAHGRSCGPLRGRLARGGGRGGIQLDRGAWRLSLMGIGKKRLSDLAPGKKQDRQQMFSERKTRIGNGSWHRGRTRGIRGDDARGRSIIESSSTGPFTMEMTHSKRSMDFLSEADFLRRNSFESSNYRDARFDGPGVWEGGNRSVQDRFLAFGVPVPEVQRGWKHGGISRPAGGKRTGTPLHLELEASRGKRPRRGF